MTTSNIKSARATADALVATAEEARARRKALAASKLGNQTKRMSIAEKEALVKEGTHVVLMHLNDQRDSLDVADDKVEEELSQLDPNYFAREETTSVDTPPEDAPPAQPAVIVTTPPVQTAPTVVLQEPQEVLGLDKAKTVTKTKSEKTRSMYDPRGLNWLQVVLGIIGGLIGFFVVKATVYPVTSFFTFGDGLNVPSHAMHWIIGILWAILLIGFGVFLGIWIGYHVWKWASARFENRDRKDTETTETTTTTTTIPAPPAA